jgi:hypothetical protein
VFAANIPDTRTSATIIMARRLDFIFSIICFSFLRILLLLDAEIGLADI